MLIIIQMHFVLLTTISLLFVREGHFWIILKKGRGSSPLLHMPGLHDVITIHSSHLHSNYILYWQLKCATSDEIFRLKVSQVMQLLTSGRMLRALFRATSQSCCFSCYSCVLSPCWDPTENWLCLQAFHSFLRVFVCEGNRVKQQHSDTLSSVKLG